VADEQEIAVVVGDRRRVRVIGGQGNDGFTALAGGDVWRHDAPALEVNGHYSPIGPARAPDMAPAKPRRGRVVVAEFTKPQRGPPAQSAEKDYTPGKFYKLPSKEYTAQ